MHKIAGIIDTTVLGFSRTSSELIDPPLHAKSFYTQRVVVCSGGNLSSSEQTERSVFATQYLLIFAHIIPRLIFRLIAFDIVNLSENEEDKVHANDAKEHLGAIVVCYLISIL